jgi:hypothetical protein
VSCNTPQLRRAGDRPQRLYLDLDGVWVGTRSFRGPGRRRPAARRADRAEPARVRVVLDLQNYSRHRVLTLSHPTGS